MFTISKDVCSLNAAGDGLVTEASTAGLPPGEWPDFVAVLNKGNAGFLLHWDHNDMSNGDIAGVHYYDRTSGVKLLIIND